jgi:hypothetical protein
VLTRPTKCSIGYDRIPDTKKVSNITKGMIQLEKYLKR